MKFLLVSLHFVEYSIELAQALSKENQIHLVLPRRKVTKSMKKILDNDLNGRFSYTLIEKYTWRNLQIWGNYFLLAKIIHRFKPDVIHLQESRDISNFVLFFYSLFIPVVGTIHDVEHHPGGMSYTSFINKLRDFIRLRVYRKIIVHGHALKEKLLTTLNRDPDDVFVVPHGCLFSFQSANSDNKVSEEDHSVLFFGRMERYKGLQYLIEAEPMVSSKIPDFKIMIVGRGKDLTANKKHLEDNPHFEIHEGYIADDKVADFFYRCAVVVLPYIEASQSGVVATALAFGKPVIVTDVGSLAEVVENGKTGLVIPPKNIGKLVEALIELLQNKEERRKMGEEALKLANTTLSWVQVAKSTQEVYQEAFKSR